MIRIYVVVEGKGVNCFFFYYALTVIFGTIFKIRNCMTVQDFFTCFNCFLTNLPVLVTDSLQNCRLGICILGKFTQALDCVLAQVWICILKGINQNRNSFKLSHKTQGFCGIHSYKGVFILVFKNCNNFIKGFYRVKLTQSLHQSLALGITQIITFKIFCN